MFLSLVTNFLFDNFFLQVQHVLRTVIPLIAPHTVEITDTIITEIAAEIVVIMAIVEIMQIMQIMVIIVITQEVIIITLATTTITAATAAATATYLRIK